MVAPAATTSFQPSSGPTSILRVVVARAIPYSLRLEGGSDGVDLGLKFNTEFKEFGNSRGGGIGNSDRAVSRRERTRGSRGGRASRQSSNFSLGSNGRLGISSDRRLQFVVSQCRSHFRGDVECALIDSISHLGDEVRAGSY